MPSAFSMFSFVLWHVSVCVINSMHLSVTDRSDCSYNVTIYLDLRLRKGYLVAFFFLRLCGYYYHTTTLPLQHITTLSHYHTTTTLPPHYTTTYMYYNLYWCKNGPIICVTVLHSILWTHNLNNPSKTHSFFHYFSAKEALF